MITKERIRNGLRNGQIRITNGYLFFGDGVVAAIGDNWFYFGGEEAENETPESYVKNVPEDDIVDEIFDALEDIRDDIDPEEYKYYDLVLE